MNANENTRPMRARPASGFLLVLAATFAASATGAESPGEPVVAECAVCHGTATIGNAALGAPNLSVLEPWYLRRQIEAYREGYRGVHPADRVGAEMRPIAAAMPAAAIEAVVGQVASLDAQPSEATIGGDVEHGETLYAACSQCHGERGQGNRELGGPRLAGQSDWYLARQLRAYREGWRGTQTQDRWGRQMRPFAMALTDEAIANVVAYIATLSGIAAQPTTRAAAGSNVPAEAGIRRVPLPNGSTFPIASMVELPPGATVIHHSGLTPRPADADADPDSRAYYGDTRTQALSVFERMKESLESAGLGMGDVVKMTVFLVGDPEGGGAMDFDGFMAAYTQFFGTQAQPNLPARSAVQVAGLVRPGMLVEIEIIAATGKR